MGLEEAVAFLDSLPLQGDLEEGSFGADKQFEVGDALRAVLSPLRRPQVDLPAVQRLVRVNLLKVCAPVCPQSAPHSRHLPACLLACPCHVCRRLLLLPLRVLPTHFTLPIRAGHFTFRGCLLQGLLTYAGASSSRPLAAFAQKWFTFATEALREQYCVALRERHMEAAHTCLVTLLEGLLPLVAGSSPGQQQLGGAWALGTRGWAAGILA